MTFCKFAELSNHNHIPILEHFHQPKKIPQTHLQLLSIPIHSHRQLLIYIMSLQIAFSGYFILRNHTVCHIFFTWLLSVGIIFLKFIHQVEYIGTFFFILLNKFPLYEYITLCLSIHQLIYIWIVSSFWLLWIMLLWKFTYKTLCLIYLGQIPRCRIASLYDKLCFPFYETAKLCSKVAGTIDIPIEEDKNSSFFTI